MRDYMLSLDSGEAKLQHNLLNKRTFVVNTNNHLITAAQKLEASHPELAAEIIRQTYELALLSQHEMDPGTLSSFITRTSHVLEQLAEHAINKDL